MPENEAITAVRERAALFDMTGERGLVEVAGEDRVRWLDGMISGDVTRLDEAGDGAGCYATLLTNRGAIIADLHVGKRGDTFLLESLASGIPKTIAALDRLLIADDVTLTDRSGDFATLGLEGRAARAILAAAANAAPPEPEAWADLVIGGADVLVGAFGWTGEAAFQLRCADGRRAAVEAALEEAAGGTLARGDLATLEVLRVEAGVPALGRELDEEVLPPEARLERAIATDKGCYVGQEIVARLRARGQVNHLLVGFALEVDRIPGEGTEVTAGERRTGELTSVAESPRHGTIALGYVRREHADPGTEITFEGGRGRVVDLPFEWIGEAPA
ncbi:MAG: glycine cleavage T C-terminal barrel domain-containing protein [Myxococcota bacterium]